MKPYCFIIFPLGHSDTDIVWERVYKPVVDSLGCNAVRIDINEGGGLIVPQIYDRISNAKFIISDLTYERPNCYFETGYAIGLNKDQRLILCCRYDHDLHRTPRNAGEPKIHFDLQSYGILWWNANDLDTFREQLLEKLKYRESLLPQPERIDLDVRPYWKTIIRYLIGRG